MAEGILEITGSDYSIAVSGIRGPEGGTPSKPVGTIWAAIAHKGNETFIWNFNLSEPAMKSSISASKSFSPNYARKLCNKCRAQLPTLC